MSAPHVPAPSAWPATLAAGITLVAAGAATNWVVLAAGAVMALVALVGWTGDLWAEPSEREK